MRSHDIGSATVCHDLTSLQFDECCILKDECQVTLTLTALIDILKVQVCLSQTHTCTLGFNIYSMLEPSVQVWVCAPDQISASAFPTASETCPEYGQCYQDGNFRTLDFLHF